MNLLKKIPGIKTRELRGSKREKCFCKVFNIVLFWGKLAGITPMNVLGKGHSECKFEVSRKWLTYSVCLQIVYFAYFCFSYGRRFICGPHNTNPSDWYVMTFGYIVTDLDCLAILLIGVTMAKRVSKILENLRAMPKSASETRVLEKRFRILMASVLVVLLIMSCSHIYVAVLRFSKQELTCSTLERGWAVLLRGVAMIFPTIQVALVFAFCEVVCLRFQYVAERTSVAIQNIGIFSLSSKPSVQPIRVINSNEAGHINNLRQLSESHRRISDIFSEINGCVGIQLLFAAASNLYAIIYYLFRYATSQHNGFASNEEERAHYVVSFGYRLAKMLMYMTIGQRAYKAALEPLKEIERFPLIDLPVEAQQQIVGNVITYLLVALQFDGAAEKMHPAMKNITEILNSLF